MDSINAIENSDPSQKGFLTALGGHVVDFIQTLVVFGAIFALIYLFVAQPHRVSGSSMYPTFHNDDYILTDKISYKLHNPEKGDVIVLKNPRNESEDFIKRVTAVPGDTLKVENNSVYVNGRLLKEPYLQPNIPTPSGSFLTEGQQVKVGDNQYFVFGDNRTHSSDSREWGPVTREEIVGRVFFRYWPPQAFGLFNSANPALVNP